MRIYAGNIRISTVLGNVEIYRDNNPDLDSYRWEEQTNQSLEF